MKTNLILPAVLLVFAMMMFDVEAESSSSSSTASSISVAGDMPSSIIPIIGITIPGINLQLPATDARTSTETFATGGATAFADAFSEASAANCMGAMIKESSASCSISGNPELNTAPFAAEISTADIIRLSGNPLLDN